jgi:O-antigen/teichoic acid export membrane protein
MQITQSSYRSIMKATSLFGGIQVLKIIIAIIRSKVIAILLGPAGMGIEGLLGSATGLVSSLSNFGLGVSAVRDVAAANENDNDKRIAKVVTVLRKLVWFTGLLGAIITFILASYLSKITFGSDEYTIAFKWLSCTLFFNQLASGQNVLLQGLRKLKYLAKANLIGSFVGLLMSLPLYYYFKFDGIVPAIILSSLLYLFFSWLFSRKVIIEKVKVTPREIIFEGKEMMKMGFMLSLSGLTTVGASYLVRIYISTNGGIDDVGLYTSGFALIFSYVGLIFTAMATDYYPKLSAIADDNKKANLLINQQAEIGILVLAPILTVFFVFINGIIELLYSTKFIPVNGMIQWAALGMYFKMASWSIAFIFLAKGASKLFFWNELVVNIYMLALNILGFYWKGLDGLGISFLITYFLYFMQVYYLTKFKYKFRFNRSFTKIFGIQFLIGISCFILMKLVEAPYSYFLGIFFILLSSLYSIKELDKRMDIKSILTKFKNK